jgi:hypothetical protein
MSAAFVLRVGAGLYMDSDGLIRPGPDAALPTYSVPGGLPVNPDSVKKAFDGIAKAMPDPTDPKVREKLGRLGVLDNTMNILATVGDIASALGKVVGVIGFAVDVARLVGLLKDGPSAVEQLVERRYQDLDRRLKGAETRWQQQDLRNMRVDIQNALGIVDGFLEEVQAGLIDTTNLQVKLQDMRNAHNKAMDAVARLLDPSTWLSGFNDDDYTRVWPWIPWPEMFRMPAGVANPNALDWSRYARRYDHGELVFDHRAMVPGVTHAVLSYLTLIKAISPEYRSTGEFDDHLLGFADKLEQLTELMRSTGLARTIAVDGQFGPLDAWEVDDPIFGTPRINEQCYRYSVGAMDLREHTNEYWDDLERQILAQQNVGGIVWTKPWNTPPLGRLPDRIGPLWARWTPPARLERATELGTGRVIYKITNVDECIAASNAQAEQDYLDLLYASGYLNLTHLVATLRHNATEPDRSETVTARVYVSHSQGEKTTVPVRTKAPFLSGVGEITGSGELRTQTTHLGVDATTQPLGRQRALEYRIVLRTVPSLAPPDRWIEPDYAIVQRASYVDTTSADLDGSQHSAKALKLETSSGLDEVELVKKRGAAEDVATLVADTFDWWIPVAPPAPVHGHPIWVEAAKHAFAVGPSQHDGSGGGGAPGDRRRMVPAGSEKPVVLTGPASADIADLVVDDVDPAALGGQHRNVRRDEVRVRWELTWVADRLWVKLSTRPEDRNFVVFLVVEEKLIPSQQWLHTAIRLPVDGQLTFIPQDFFDREREAAERAGEVAAALRRKWAKSRGPGPKGPGPLLDGVNPAEMNTPAGLNRLLEAAATHEPQLLREVLRDFPGYAPELDRRLSVGYRGEPESPDETR